MADLPRGTVTLLFTDIEGSTTMLQELGRRRYVDALETHRRLLRDAFSSHGGIEVEMQGDSFHFAFPYARDAVAAAVEAQRELSEYSWPDAAISVRMGLHTGEPEQSDGLYAGIDVHRAARVMGAAHGGQILLSGRTADIVEGELPEGATVTDLGRHRLKGLTAPLHLHQLTAPGLRAEFPPPTSDGAVGEIDLAQRPLARLNRKARRHPWTAAAVGAIAVAAVGLGAYAAVLDDPSPATALTPVPSNSLAAVDQRSNAVQAHVPVGTAPTTVAWGAGGVWVLNSQNFTISRVEPETLETREIAPGLPLSDLATGFGAVWAVTRCPENTLLRIEPDGNVERRIRLPRFNRRSLCVGEDEVKETDSLRGPWPNSVTTGLGAVWVVSQRDASVWRVDPRTGAVTKTYTLPTALIYDPTPGVAAGEGAVWIAWPGELLRLDPRAGTFSHIETTHVGGDVAVSSGYVWVTDTLPDGELRQIDPRGDDVIRTIATGGGPRGVAGGVDATWVANSFDGTIARVHASNGGVLAKIVVGGSPYDVAVGGGTIWVTVG